ncbi:hypothetical protein T484DRAFT_1877576 [Baffinella frigidus]|nr:hypothetical protein T484DRAFT_1877576 [Cryptophyta sp. CCMP2293]
MDSLHISSMVPHETPEDLQWGGAAGVDEQWSDWSDEEAGEGSAVQMAKEAKEKMKLVLSKGAEKLKRFSKRFLTPSSPLTFPRPSSSLPPQLEEVFAQAALPILLELLPPAALARVSQVCKSWRAVATDERLWERHVRADTLCKNTLTHDGLAKLGGWRRFYSVEARLLV